MSPLGLHGTKRLVDQAVGITSTAIPHGLPFTPRVYMVVAKHATAARFVSIISVGAVNINAIADDADTTADFIVGPPVA